VRVLHDGFFGNQKRAGLEEENGRRYALWLVDGFCPALSRAEKRIKFLPGYP
jgi:hypothetical protein